MLVVARPQMAAARGRDAVVGVLSETAASLGFAHAEVWLPRFAPNGSAVLEIAATSFERDGRSGEEQAADPLREFVACSADLRLQAGYGLPGRVWASAQPEWTRDVRSAPPQSFLRGAIAVSHGLSSALGIPISQEGEPELCAVAVFFSASHEEPSLDAMAALGAAMRRLARAVAALPLAPPSSGGR